MKCRSSPAIIPRPFRIGSEPQPSQREVYVCFDRANAIEPLLVDVKCTYHVNSSRLVARVERWAPSSLLVQSRRYACASRLLLASRRRNQPGRFARAFHPVVVCFNMTGSFIMAVRRMRMLSLSRSPPASVWRGSRVADMLSP